MDQNIPKNDPFALFLDLFIRFFIFFYMTVEHQEYSKAPCIHLCFYFFKLLFTQKLEQIGPKVFQNDPFVFFYQNIFSKYWLFSECFSLKLNQTQKWPLSLFLKFYWLNFLIFFTKVNQHGYLKALFIVKSSCLPKIEVTGPITNQKMTSLFSENLFISKFLHGNRGLWIPQRTLYLIFTRILVFLRSGSKEAKLSQKFTHEISIVFFMNVEGYKHPKVLCTDFCRKFLFARRMKTKWAQKYILLAFF